MVLKVSHRWLGQNSKQGKLQRQLNDIQVRMRLVVTSDKPQIRQAYIPALYPRLVNPLLEKGKGKAAVGITLSRRYPTHHGKERNSGDHRSYGSLLSIQG
jgi:hypothetical protein